MAHKDVDARWTKKRDESRYGYKDHVKADKNTELIKKYHSMDASVHDSNVAEPLIDEKDKRINWLSSTAYWRSIQTPSGK